MPLHSIQMIVMDMDDTLLSSDHSISDKNIRAIKAAKEAGIVIVLASGRPTPAMAFAASALELDQGGFVISYNGAYVTDWAEQNVLFETCLSKYEHDLLVDTAHAQNSYIHTYVDGEILTDEDNEFTDIEAKLTKMPVKVVEDLKHSVSSSVPKVLMVSEPTNVTRMQAELSKAFDGRFTISISKPYFLEFTNQNVDKSKAIDVVCALTGIDKTNVMAIGDSYNDLTMLRDCGIGVAMGNAPEDIKNIANKVTKPNDQHGVADIIEEVLNSLP